MHAAIKQRWDLMEGVLDERQRRLLLGVEAKILGRGGISAVAAATGVSRGTVASGLGEIEGLTASDGLADPGPTTGRAGTAPWRGRKKLADTYPTFVPWPRSARSRWCRTRG